MLILQGWLSMKCVFMESEHQQAEWGVSVLGSH